MPLVLGVLGMEGIFFSQNLLRISAHLSLRRTHGEHGGGDMVKRKMNVLVEVVSLDERPPVDIDNVALAVRAKQVEAANVLLERDRNVARHLLLRIGKLADEANLLALGVATDEAIDDGRLARLGVHKVGAERVDLDVLRVLDVDELLIDIRAVGARYSHVGLEG